MPVPLPKNAVQKYSGPLLQVYQYEQPLYDDSVAIFETVARPDTVTILPFVKKDIILMTHQEQPHKTEPFWALPGGRVDTNETHIQAAQRELKEETGTETNAIEHWQTKTWKGIMSYEEVFFVAKNISTCLDGSHLDPGERITLVEMSWQDLIQLCFEQKLRGSTLIGLILAMEFDPVSKKRLQKFVQG